MAFVTSPLGISSFASTASKNTLSTGRQRSAVVPRRSVARATLGEKFGHLRNADVPSVSDTVKKFTDDFGRPVPIVYRAIVNELLTTTHLSVVCALWQYDVIFAYGFEHVFKAFLGFYPNQSERDDLRNAVANSLGLNPKLLAADAAKVDEFVDTCGGSVDELFTKVGLESGVVIDGFKAPLKASKYEYYYSRCYGIGLIAIMEKLGQEVTADTGAKWANKLGLDLQKFQAEIGVYISGIDRLKQAENIFAEAAAREAKKTADRLANRAEAAQKKLEALEKGEDVDGTGNGTGEGGDGGSEELVSPVATVAEDKST